MKHPTLEEWSDNLHDNVDGVEFQRALKRTLAPIALHAQRNAALLATTRLRVRTGRLRRSIGSGVRIRGRDRVEAFVQARTPYAAMQERGGIVTAKKKYLTIPLGPMKTAAGVTRQSARTMPGLFPYRSKNGHLFLARRTETGLQLMFLLKRSVRIRGRHYLRDGMRKAAMRLPVHTRRLLQQTVKVGR